ncbi:MAG TPA: hypothetical protein DCK98_00915 [Chloroflexi bacterium]|nr:hypothetical protein [Chloroflexota bacterium]HAL25390.1 hypothetical protein [Chloroflexota bacterium]
MFRDTTNWTKAHWAWIRAQRFDLPLLERLRDEHVVAIEMPVSQRDQLERELHAIALQPPYAAAARRLSALRGVQTLTALTLFVEVGDFARFGSAAEFMGFTKLVPSEYSSGNRRHQGAITKDRQFPSPAGPGRSRLGVPLPAGVPARTRPPPDRSAGGGAGPLCRDRAAAPSAVLADGAARQAHPGRRGGNRPRACRGGLGPDARHHGGRLTVRTSLGTDERTSRKDPRKTYAVWPTCGRTRVASRRQLPTDHCHAVSIREYQSGLKSPLPPARPSPIDVRAPPVTLDRPLHIRSWAAPPARTPAGPSR